MPDESSNPVWLPLDGEPAEAPSAPGEFWADEFNTAAANDQVRFWQGGVFPEDGLWKSFAGQWYAASAAPNWEDTDGDGLPDLFDQYPGDPSNNTFAWEGGTFTINGIRHMFRSDIYAGTFEDSDENGVPDSLMSWFTNPSAHGTLQTWQGGSVIINGEWNTFGAISYHAPALVDQDGDGLPDEIDPFPSDVWNNTYSNWGPLTIRIDGEEQSFEESQAAGTGLDADTDGIPDTADPYPNDANNNSAWWNGGSFVVNGETVNYDGRYHRASAGDSDNDGIPDDILEPVAPSGFTWPEATLTVLISDVEVQFTSQYFEGSWSDEDGDGIPDQADPYPAEWRNGNTNPDLDDDGIADAWETMWGLSTGNPLDAVLSMSGDGVTNLEKYQLGLNPTVIVTPPEYRAVTGQSWESFVANRNNLLSILEQDFDADLVSNVDEITVFNTDFRNTVSVPTAEEIITAINNLTVSATTLMNFQHLTTGGGGGGGRVTITLSGVPTSFTKGVAVSGSVSASGGVEPYTFSGSGLPTGVTISSTGVISGTPTGEGSFDLTVSATDSNGASGSGSSSGTVAQPPETITLSAHGVYSNSWSRLEELQTSGYSVVYESEYGEEVSTTVGVELGSQGKLAVSKALNVSESSIKKLEQSLVWVTVTSTSGRDFDPEISNNLPADQFVPPAPDPGYVFDDWVLRPKDVSSGPNETTSYLSPTRRFTQGFQIFSWSASWSYKKSN